MKSCATCGAEFEWSGKGNKSYCPLCTREYARKWRAANPVAMCRYKEKWEAKHPEEVKAAKRRRYHQKLEYYREMGRAWRARNPEKVAAQQARRLAKDHATGRGILYRHGITREQRQALESFQGGHCALCSIPLATLTTRSTHIDHDHATGHIRGILCGPCNVRLGWYEKRAELVAEYLAGPHVVPAKRRASSRRGDGPVKYERW